jgi:hypothetical protein
MTAPANLPSLFGRFTAILQDHEHLGTTLKHLRLMCVELDTPELVPLTLSPPRVLEDLQLDLSRHFAAEEAEPYFGTIAEEVPPLLPRIEQLKNEHAAMLEAIATLCRIAADVTLRAELCGGTRELIVQLERHERAESLLLRELFAPG